MLIDLRSSVGRTGDGGINKIKIFLAFSDRNVIVPSPLCELCSVWFSN